MPSRNSIDYETRMGNIIFHSISSGRSDREESLHSCPVYELCGLRSGCIIPNAELGRGYSFYDAGSDSPADVLIIPGAILYIGKRIVNSTGDICKIPR